MAVASYTTDLTTFNDATSATGWGEFTNMAQAGGPDTDTDLAILGTICITQDRARVGLCSQGYDGNAVTLATGECFFIWTKFFAPNSLDSLSAGGQRVVVGSSLATWDAWYMDGDDTYGYGGWKNYVVDPTFASDANNGTVTTYNAVGNGWLLTAAPQKGNPFNTDIIRYGRGESIFTGGDLANGYATFAGYALVNDNATTGRFGLIQAQGLGYLYKGLMSLGTATTAVDMRDSNTQITIDDTTKVLSTFNRIEVNHASSNIEWVSIQFGALGTVSKGQFEAVANATIEKTSCTFTDMDSFIYQSNSTMLTTQYVRCGLVTQGSADFTSCTFDEPSGTVGLSVDTLGTIVSCIFNSDGTGYAVDLGNITTTQSLDWKNTESGYVTGSTGSDVGVTPTGNETILCNVSTGETLTINVTTGASTPSVANSGSGTVAVVSSFTLTLTNVAEGAQVTIVNSSTRAELQNTVSAPASGIVTYAHSGGETVDILFMDLDYDPLASDQYDLLLPSADSSIKINMVDDPNFDNPA